MKYAAGENISFWDRIASRYDRAAERIGGYGEMIERIADAADGAGRVLDAAAGTGLASIRLAERAEQVVAVDVSAEMIALAKAKQAEACADNLSFSLASCYALPFADDAFDLAVCANALHVIKDPQQALAELHRTLKPGARLIAPTYCVGQTWSSRLLAAFMPLAGFRIYHRWTLDSFRRTLQSNGFFIETIERLDHHFPLAFVVAIKN